MKNKFSILKWAPRIICILAILFISIFAFDVFSPELSIWQQLEALFIHQIPSFILTGILIISWKWEFIGGILFTIIGIGLSPFVFILNYRMNHSIFMSLFIILLITIPFLLVGILFLMSHYMKKKNFQLSQK